MSGLEINNSSSNTNTNANANDVKVYRQRANEDVRLAWKALLHDDNDDDDNDTNTAAEVVPSVTASLSTDMSDSDKDDGANNISFAW